MKRAVESSGARGRRRYTELDPGSEYFWYLMYSTCSVGTEAKVPHDVGRGEQQSWRFSRGRSP